MPSLARSVLLAISTCCGAAMADAFEDFFVPNGAPDMDIVTILEDGGPCGYVSTTHGIYRTERLPGRKVYFRLSTEAVSNTFLHGDKILFVFVKQGPPKPRPCFAGENGEIWCVQELSSSSPEFDQNLGRYTTEAGGQARITKATGDDLYVLTTTGLGVTHDFKTWQSDTAGLGKAVATDIAMDTAQTFWATFSSGLMRRTLKATAWAAAPGWPASTNALKVFCDRKGRILVATYKGPMLSVDAGAAFTADSAGIGAKSVVGFGDDAFGNLYALVSPDLVYVSKGGDQPWVKSVTGLEVLAGAADGAQAVHSIVGDSVVILSTAAGAFVSEDQGAHWARHDSGITDPNTSLMRKLADGSVVSSNGFGLYRRAGAGDWAKIFPDSGTIRYRPFFEDSAGAWHTLGRFLTPRNYPMPMVRSGLSGTWAPDTQGIAAVTAFNSPLGRDGFYFCDRQGRQYLADVWTTASGAKLWSKVPGSAWAPDTAGLGVLTGFSMQGNAFGQDAAGNLYWSLTATTGVVVSKPAAGGAWALDTVGLGGNFVYSFAAGKDGKLWAGSLKGLMYREGGSWHTADLPSPALAGMAAFAVSVDAAGTVWAGYSEFTGPTNAGKGAWFSNDNGKTWTLAGLPNTTVRAFFPMGDTMRVSTYGLGIYKLTKAAMPIGIAARAAVGGVDRFRLLSHPFAAEQRLEMDLREPARVEVVSEDLRGRSLGLAYSGLCGAGRRLIRIDTSKLPPGMHLLRITSSTGANAGLKFMR